MAALTWFTASAIIVMLGCLCSLYPCYAIQWDAKLFPDTERSVPKTSFRLIDIL
ncbi:hypothetical protein BDW66DRAFT_145920 [Aspergillus desertorum]